MDGMIRVNGEPIPREAQNVAALVEDLGLSTRTIAVAVNGTLVPRAAWVAKRLADGDVVEIVGAVQGG